MSCNFRKATADIITIHVAALLKVKGICILFYKYLHINPTMNVQEINKIFVERNDNKDKFCFQKIQ